MAQWANVLFTDESSFCLDFMDRRTRVWLRANEQINDATVVERNPYGGGSIKVWDGLHAILISIRS